MIVQLLSKAEDRYIEQIHDNVETVEVTEDGFSMKTSNGVVTSIDKNKCKSLRQAWLLNDNFKTLKRLI